MLDEIIDEVYEAIRGACSDNPNMTAFCALTNDETESTRIVCSGNYFSNVLDLLILVSALREIAQNNPHFQELFDSIPDMVQSVCSGTAPAQAMSDGTGIAIQSVPGGSGHKPPKRGRKK